MEQDNANHNGANHNGTHPNGNSAATGVVEQAQQVASQAVGQVQEKASQAVGQAQQKAGQVVGHVQSEAVTRLSKQKDQAAQGLGSVAQALRHTSEELRTADNGAVAQFAAQYNEAAVAQIEKVSNFLRERDINDIVHEVEGFARREPVLFMGGAFLLGMLAARFLKSSTPDGAYTGSRAIVPHTPQQALATTGTSPVGTGSFDAATYDPDTIDLGPTPDDDSALT